MLCLIPFYLIFINSFMYESDIIRYGYSFWPGRFSTNAYRALFRNPGRIINAYGITIFVTAAGSFLSLLTVTMTAFVLSRKDFYWRNKISFFFFFTTLFNGGLVPYYLFLTQVLHINNTIFGLLLPLLFSVWNMIVSMNFFRGLPYEIIESAKIDGANDFIVYMRLIIPISTPLLATIGLFTALSYWNDWYNCMLFIGPRHRHLYTLQYLLQIISRGQQSGSLAETIIATGPMMLAYPFIQRFFVRGLTIGSVKG